MSKGLAIVLILFIGLLIYWNNHHNKWSLFVYPYGDTLNEPIISLNNYNSFEECKKSFEFNLISFPDATFECGYKCKTHDVETEMYICKETRD